MQFLFRFGIKYVCWTFEYFKKINCYFMKLFIDFNFISLLIIIFSNTTFEYPFHFFANNVSCDIYEHHFKRTWK